MQISVLPGRELGAGDASRWRALQASNPDLGGPYFCPEFTSAVAAVREDVHVAVVERDGEVVAYLPHQRDRTGHGRPVGGHLSDHHGVIAAPGTQFDAIELVRGAGLASWEFDHLIASQSAFVPHHTALSESPVLDLSGGFDAYAAERRAAGSKQIKKLGTLRRKLEREVGPLHVDHASDDRDVLARLIGWKSAQARRGEGGVDLFSAGWVGDLLHRLLDTRTDEFAGTLSVLRAGDELVAAHFGMRSATVWHYWFPSYDHAYGRYSPGLLLLVSMAEAAEAMGVTSIDMGKGDAFYKSRMRSRGIAIAEGRVEVPSLAMSARRFRENAERWVKDSPLATPARVPGRAIKRFEKWLRTR